MPSKKTPANYGPKKVVPREQKRKTPVSPYRRPGQTSSTVRG